MHENVCYKKPFLKDVILRLDFGSMVESFTRALPQKVATAALQRFPLFEPQKAQIQEITFSTSALQTKTADSMQWVYHGKNREKALTITPEFFLITNRQYESFEAFHEDFDHVLKTLFEAQNDLSVGRVGLRYINVLDTPGDEPLAWADYINEGMLGIIDMHKDVKALTRAFHIVEFNYDGQHVKFQFGISNPDYPAPIKRRQFVLDIDSYFTGALTQEDVARCVNAAHEKIQALFEESITDKTRALMKPATVQ
ncbi:MAG: TIGR04255 family protein [Pseudomonadota bacterium]